MIKRKWALVIAIIATIVEINNLLSGNFTNPEKPSAYNAGSMIGGIAIPTIFYVLAFLPKKKK